MSYQIERERHYQVKLIADAMRMANHGKSNVYENYTKSLILPENFEDINPKSGFSSGDEFGPGI